MIFVPLAVDWWIVVHKPTGAHERPGTRFRQAREIDPRVSQVDHMPELMGEVGQVNAMIGVFIAANHFGRRRATAPGRTSALHGIGTEAVDKKDLYAIIDVDFWT